VAIKGLNWKPQQSLILASFAGEGDVFLELVDGCEALVVDGLDEDDVGVECIGRADPQCSSPQVAYRLLQFRRARLAQSLVADQIVKSFAVELVFRHRLQTSTD